MRRLPKRLAERLWFGLAGAAIMAAVAGTTAYVTAPDPPAMRIAPEPVMPSPTLSRSTRASQATRERRRCRSCAGGSSAKRSA